MEGSPLHFFDLPIVAWRTKGEQLIPMLFEDGFYGPEWAVAGPDGKVSTGAAIRFDRKEYEAQIIASDPRAKAELDRRDAIKREREANAKLAAMAQRSAA
jgi:hypothetical protein